MPELPEVEVVTRTLQTFLHDTVVQSCIFRRDNLRDTIPKDLVREVLVHQEIKHIYRRSKYIILETSAGRIFFHLGMTGKFVYRHSGQKPMKHAHASFLIKKGPESFHLDYVDPRRFGLIDAMPGHAPLEQHALFCKLGPEPLSLGTLAQHMFRQSRGKRSPVKSVLMDPHFVVGVGNIYASESLFLAGIHPRTHAGALELEDYSRLAKSVKAVLRGAIRAGGTTIRDFKGADGQQGYFKISLKVYDRKDKPCKRCQHPVQMQSIGGRSSFFCDVCQISK